MFPPSSSIWHRERANGKEIGGRVEVRNFMQSIIYEFSLWENVALSLLPFSPYISILEGIEFLFPPSFIPFLNPSALPPPPLPPPFSSILEDSVETPPHYIAQTPPCLRPTSTEITGMYLHTWLITQNFSTSCTDSQKNTSTAIVYSKTVATDAIINANANQFHFQTSISKLLNQYEEKLIQRKFSTFFWSSGDVRQEGERSMTFQMDNIPPWPAIPKDFPSLL